MMIKEVMKGDSTSAKICRDGRRRFKKNHTIDANCIQATFSCRKSEETSTDRRATVSPTVDTTKATRQCKQ